MKQLNRILALLLLVCVLVPVLASCVTPGGQKESVDYVSQVQLDMDSETLKQEVTVKAYIDGDTTHFYVPTSVSHTGILKARYLAINTPESTGKIEEWGKKASNFTKTKLKEAESIIVESDDSKWNVDSTGDRFLVWVWYKEVGSDSYRNLNLELLQEGLAIASNSSQNRYGQFCVDAIAQARDQKINVYSNAKDPDFFYGEAVPVSLSELRANIETYDGQKVAFTGIVAEAYNNGVYVESYDEEAGMYVGMYVYYGFNLSGAGIKILSVGNEVLIKGTVSYYETGDSWQVSGLSYRARVPDDPDNIQKLSEGHAAAYPLTTAEQFTSKVEREVIVDGEETIKEFSYAELCLGTSIAMNGLKVVSAYTTDNEESSSNGAITLTCKVGNITVDVRTAVLRNEDGQIVTEDYFLGKTIDVKGIIDEFQGKSQIKVFSLEDIVIH